MPAARLMRLGLGTSDVNVPCQEVAFTTVLLLPARESAYYNNNGSAVGGLGHLYIQYSLALQSIFTLY